MCRGDANRCIACTRTFGRKRRHMSVREVVNYVQVRGTAISTSFAFPSTLHVTVVHKFGLPNRHGVISCDGYLLYLRFDHKDDRLVHVWAQSHEEAHASYCAVS